MNTASNKDWKSNACKYIALWDSAKMLNAPISNMVLLERH